MKWLIYAICLVLIAFAGLIGAGYFLPAQQTIERSYSVNAHVEDIFPYIDDLETYAEWNLFAVYGNDVELAFGGPESGVGQSAAWQIDQDPIVIGAQEIIESQAPEFVRSIVNVNGVIRSQTFALSEVGDGTAIVLLHSEQELGGFPYLQRVTARLSQGRVAEAHDAVLMRLKTSVEYKTETAL